MNTNRNPRHQAALASLEAAFGASPRPTTRPAAVVSAEPGSRRLILSLARA